MARVRHSTPPPFGMVASHIIRDHTLSEVARLVYALLTTYAIDVRQVFPGRVLLSRQIGKSVRTIDRAIKELCDRGIVTVEHRQTSSGDADTNLYVLHDWDGVATPMTPPLEAPAPAGNAPSGVATPMTPPGDTDDATSSHPCRQGGDTHDPTGGDTGVSIRRPVGRRPIEEEPSSSAAKPHDDDTDPTEQPSTTLEPIRDDVERICTHLADRIEAGGSKRPTITAKWRREARLMLDRDGRTEQQIRAAIDWCQNDPFWCANVMSMPKLREKYDQLRLAAQRQRPSGAHVDRRQQATDDLFDRAQQRARARMEADG